MCNHCHYRTVSNIIMLYGTVLERYLTQACRSLRCILPETNGTWQIYYNIEILPGFIQIINRALIGSNDRNGCGSGESVILLERKISFSVNYFLDHVDVGYDIWRLAQDTILNINNRIIIFWRAPHLLGPSDKTDILMTYSPSNI